MAKKKTTTTTAPDVEGSSDESTKIEDGKVLDYITGKPVADNDKETVRQRIARALFHEYGLSVEDMQPDFKVKVDGSNKKIDIAIFEPGTEHIPENVRRLVVCQKELKVGDKGSYRMRDHEQAAKDLELLKDAMAACENCKYGLWTNGLEFFFFRVDRKRFDAKFIPIGDWPLSDESIGTRDVASHAKLRRADPEMLRTAFRRCHNFIHGNEGMPKDAAFWQFLYLIFAKMHDERQANDKRRFWAGRFEKNGQLIDEQFDPTGQKAIRDRIKPLFDEVKKKYSTVFRGGEEITLSDRALAFMVSELAKYDFGRTDVDAKGAAYQEIVGTNLRGDRGQYFTPRGAIKLVVSMLDPKPNERVIDPACGTGGFLTATLAHLAHKFQAEKGIEPGAESTQELISIQERLGEFVKKNLFGADFDPFLVRAAQMNAVMASNAEAHLFNLNSLEFPSGHLTGVADAKKFAQLGTMDVVMTNPPFGSDIPVTDPNILRHFELAHVWERTDDGTFRNTGKLQGSVAPEVLFVERCIDWLKPGGRLGIVLPDGILGNPSDEYIRAWILRRSWVLASIDLPVEVFVSEANVNILTSLLFLKKKSDRDVQAEDLGRSNDYKVFMAVAERVGVDRRGNVLYRRSPEGEDLMEDIVEQEKIRIGGQFVTRTLRRKRKVVDDDLPRIADAYRRFRKEFKEPGV
ncbi:methylation-associated defense system DNA methyltransferase MAD2 [Sorangium sp. So ce861]|uniref:methylation-associated defense system DNA methyltransferase MAD2 n=1 Tax=Sorangium sp. So ce861 TaxID=3133323 RepID=UPI003F5D65A9